MVPGRRERARSRRRRERRAGRPPSWATMPADKVGSRTSSSSAVNALMTSSLVGQSAYRPSTSVSTTSFSAAARPRARPPRCRRSRCRCRACPSASKPRATLETTGIRPSSSRLVTTPGSTVAMSPTRPISTGSPSTIAARRSAVNRCAVFATQPDRERAVRVEQADDLTLHLADQHHADDVHRLRRGDP